MVVLEIACVFVGTSIDVLPTIVTFVSYLTYVWSENARMDGYSKRSGKSETTPYFVAIQFMSFVGS